MEAVLLIFHIVACIGMVVLVLLQRSEGGALGIGGGPGSMFTGSGATNIITRSTTILAIAFFSTTLLLSFNARRLQANSLADAAAQSNEVGATTQEGSDQQTPTIPSGLDFGTDVFSQPEATDSNGLQPETTNSDVPQPETESLENTLESLTETAASDVIGGAQENDDVTQPTIEDQSSNDGGTADPSDNQPPSP